MSPAEKEYTVGEAAAAELPQLMALYLHLHDIPTPEREQCAAKVWARILESPDYHVIVARKNGEVCASCTCVVVPNLTQNARPYALIENVITRPGFRRRGLATRCLAYAAGLAQAAGCYRVMLMTGAKDDATLNFYKKAGFDATEKTAFVRRLS